MAHSRSRGPLGTFPPLLHSRHVRSDPCRRAAHDWPPSVLERTAPANSEVTVFSAVFVIVALGSIFVTLNAKVLGGQCSVFQSVCVLGYCLFPLVLDAIVLEIIRIVAFHSFLLQLFLSLGAFLWSTFCTRASRPPLFAHHSHSSLSQPPSVSWPRWCPRRGNGSLSIHSSCSTLCSRGSSSSKCPSSECLQIYVTY